MLKINLIVQKVATLVDRSVKLTMITPELKPEAMTELFSMNGAEVACVLKKSDFDGRVIEAVDLPKQEGKTPSSRLRNVLYIDWRENTKQTEPFDIFYIRRMEQIIEHVKSRLPELDKYS